MTPVGSPVVDGATLLRSVGLSTDGLALLGRPVAARTAGLYIVELAAPLPTAPIDLARVGKWIERVPGLHLDGERPTSRALRARLAAFWIPGTSVLFVGSAERTIAGRVTALEQHVLGNPRPHPAAQWLKALDADGLRVRWAETDAAQEYEDAVLEAFAAAVPDEQRAALFDPDIVLPFANLRRPTGERKRTGLTGSTLPQDVPPPAPEPHVVELPPGDAEGAATEPRGSGTVRRTNAAPPPARPARQARAAGAGRPPRAARPAVGRGAGPLPSPAARAEPVVLTAEGHARARAELDELVRVRRPEVIARIRAARELGDLRENADYAAAREEQSFLEGRIQALEAMLRTAVVSAAAGPGRVALGSRVRVDVGGEEHLLTIVGRAESDPARGRISDASPVGQALLGRSAGDEATVRTPAGEVRYRVLAIE